MQAVLEYPLSAPPPDEAADVGRPSVGDAGKLGFRWFWRYALPHRGLGRRANAWRVRNLRRLLWPFVKLQVARLLGIIALQGVLYLRVDRADGTIEHLGLASLKVVTTAGATKIVDFLRANDTTTGANFKFHGVGTGSTAEAVGDTALVTELTTQYATDSTRPTGSQTNNGATVYRSVGTIAPDSGFPIVLREHGLFSASSAGTLLDRSVYGAATMNVLGDSITPTYDFTVNTGG